jgi:drug/metabolite transporter (DMT)-like permease
LAASLILAAMGATVKLLGGRLHIFQVAFFRCAFGLVVLAPFLARPGAFVGALRTRHLGLHVVRVGLGTTAMFCVFYSLTHLPLADAVTLTFTQSLFMIPLAALVLHETVHARRWIATGTGFIGVIILVQPSGTGYGIAAGVALFAALLVTVVRLMVKHLTATERPLTLLLYFGLLSSLISAGPAIAVWRAPDAAELALLILVGTLGVAGQACMIRGIGAGDISAVAPFEYARLLFAAIFGYLLFADLPSSTSVVGAAIIVASTLVLGRAELRAKSTEN